MLVGVPGYFPNLSLCQTVMWVKTAETLSSAERLLMVLMSHPNQCESRTSINYQLELVRDAGFRALPTPNALNQDVNLNKAPRKLAYSKRFQKHRSGSSETPY